MPLYNLKTIDADAAPSNALRESNFFGNAEVVKIGKFESSEGITYAFGQTDVYNLQDSPSFAEDWFSVIESIKDTYGDNTTFKQSNVDYNGSELYVITAKGEWHSDLFYFDRESGKINIFKTLDISEKQWNFASGESDYLGDGSVSSANEHSVAFWEPIDYKSTSTSNLHFFNNFDDDYKYEDNNDLVKEDNNYLVKLEKEDLIFVQNVAANLRFSTLGAAEVYANPRLAEPYTTSGYAFDLGYYNVLGRKFHAGMDFSVGQGDPLTPVAVKSPITGHVIEIAKKDSAINSHIVVREIDGDRVWSFGHVDPSKSLAVGVFLNAGDPIGTLHEKESGHERHLHISAAESEAAKAIVVEGIGLDGEQGGRALTDDERAGIQDYHFPTENLTFSELNFEWEKEVALGGAHGQSSSLESVLKQTDSPLQAYFEQNPFAAMGVRDLTSDGLSIGAAAADPFSDFNEIGGGRSDPASALGIEDVFEEEAEDRSPADIVITDAEIVSSYRLAEEPIHIDFIVRNVGETRSDKGSVSVYLSQDGNIDSSDILLGEETFSRLSGGEFDTESVYSFLPDTLLPGSYRILLEAVTYDDVESTSNNTASIDFHVSDVPDQVVIDTLLDFSEAESNAGYPVLDFEVRNVGYESTGSTQLGLFLSDSSDFDDAILIGDKLLTLQSGESKSGTFILEGVVGDMLDPEKDQHVFVVANHENVGFETNYTDNRSGPIRLNPDFMTPIDLSIDNMEMSSSQFDADNRPSITTTISNLGESFATGVQIGYFASKSGLIEDAIYLGDIAVTMNGLSTVTQEFQISSSWADKMNAASSYFIFAVADHDGQKGDANSENDRSAPWRIDFPDYVSEPPLQVMDAAVEAEEDTSLSGSLSAYVAGGDISERTYTISEDALHGSVQLKSDGSYDYVADENFYGQDSFSFVVNDGGNSQTGTVVINVSPVNDAPSEIKISGADVFENASNGSVVGVLSFIDPDFDDIHTISLADDANNRFAMNGDTLVTTRPLDHEAFSSHRVTVVVDDGNDGVAEKDIVIRVLDIQESTLGNDVLFGTSSSDTIFGNAGDDRIVGYANDDVLFGNEGNDTILGGGGVDVIYAGTGDDWAQGGKSGDTLKGDFGDDTLIGGAGADKLVGQRGADVLRGGAGDDFVKGSGGHDLLIGARGDDLLLGGGGVDTLKGGGGSDVFEFMQRQGTDVVVDFQQGSDLLKFRGARDFDDFTISQQGSDVLISFGQSSAMILGSSVADFSSTDFLF